MEIEVEQEKLSKALNAVSRVATGRSTLPILNNVLIKVENNRASLTTTNLDMAVVDYIPIASSEPGEVTVPAKLIAEFVSNLPRGELLKLSVSGAKLTISAGKYSSTINGALANDFPELPELDESKSVIFKLPVDEFKLGVSEVILCTSSDTTRPAFTGVYFNTNNEELCIAATDGYRLAEKKLVKNVKSEVAAVVPASALQEVMHSLSDDMEEIEIAISSDLIRFRVGEIEIISKLIDAPYPNYRNLIHENNKVEVELKCSELSRVVKLAALFSRTSGGVIECSTVVPDKFIVKSITNELGENESEITADVKVESKIRLNSRYFLDAIGTIEEDGLIFKFDGPSVAATIVNAKKKDYFHMIMPLNG